MKFVDSCEVKVVGGKGGNGCIAFRREKFVPFGGPAGGDGGRGGDVIFLTDPGLSTLLDITHAHTLKGEDGENGMGKDCYGKAGADLVVRVPVGTQVVDLVTGVVVFDLDQPNVQTVIGRGGKGGRGNIHFATAHDRAPRRSEPGEEGIERRLRLDLKVMADVGLLGFPNVGKSTFIRAVSHARPKVADYPFTTLVPHLGVVSIGEEASFVLADIPGLIAGAAEGAGLGVRFLKHVERTRVLLHLVTLDPTEGRDPFTDWQTLNAEMQKFDPELAKRPQIVAMSKADMPEVQEAYPKIKAQFKKEKVELFLVSAATGQGVRELSIALYQRVKGRHDEDEFQDESTPEQATVEPTEKAPPVAPKKKATPVAPKKTATVAPKKKVALKPKKATAKPKKATAKPKKATAKLKKAAAKPKKATVKKR